MKMNNYIGGLLSVCLLASVPAWAADNAAAKPVSAAEQQAQINKELYNSLMKKFQEGSKEKDIKKALPVIESIWAEAEKSTLSDTQKYDLGFAVAKYWNEKAKNVKQCVALCSSMLDQFKDLPAQQKMNLATYAGRILLAQNFPSGGKAAYNDDGIDEALAFYKKYCDNTGFTPVNRVELYRLIADCYLEKMMVDEVNAVLKKALDISPETRNAAIENQYKAYVRQLDYETAGKLLDSLFKAAGNDERKLLDLEAKKIDLINASQGVDKAIEYIMNHKTLPDSKVVDYLIKFEKAHLAEGYLKKVLNNNEENFRTRMDAYLNLFKIAAKKRGSLEDVLKFRKENEAFEKTPDFQANYARRYQETLRGWYGRDLDPYYEIRVYVLDQITGKKYHSPYFQETLDNLIKLGRKQEILQRLDSVLKNTPENEMKPAERLKYQNNLAILSAKPKDAEKVAKKVVTSVKAFTSKAEEQERMILDNAKFALVCEQEDIAEKLWNERSALLVKREPRSLNITFIKDGPKDITSYLASDYFKNVKNRATLDRKYGDNLQFLLETDSAITNRVITQNDGKNIQHTFFTASCDEEGIKIMLFMPCTPEKAESIRKGFTTMGGYEMYLTRGYGTPYDCLMPSCELGISVCKDAFVTQYDNPKYRNFGSGGYASLECRLVEGGVAGLFRVDWTAYVDKLPENGTVWEFEPIHWENGGWTWGGSESVHNRSSYGRLIFDNMSRENLAIIKHRLLPKAKAKYRAEFSEGRNGCLEFYLDPELGDPEFYHAEIAPLIKKYDAYAERIKADMSVDEIHEVFVNAYQFMMNVPFYVSELRAEYLQRKYTVGTDAAAKQPVK